MKFYELLETVEFGPIWECLQSYYDLEDWLFIDYQRVYNELRNMEPAVAKDKMLLVVNKEHAEEVGGEGLDFEVFGIKSGDPQRYGLEFEPWEEWLSYQVLQEPVALYGPVAVAAHSLYELPYIGFTNEAVKSEKAKISKIYKGIMNEG